MDVLRERSAGLDVHRSVIVACVLTSSAGAPVSKAVQSFAATAAGLMALVSWLRGFAVTHVGMEGTGVYWMAVYAALGAAGGLTPIAANARHIKAVPGRKTDAIDAEWIARLIRYALVRASFVPPRPIRDLRELTRYRRTLVEVAASERRRLLKLLESADMKLAEGCLYRDLGESYLDRRTEQQTLKRYARKLNPLGYAIVPKQEAATMAA